MLKILILRLLLVALPFMVWLVWMEIAKWRGRPMGSTPWAWLLAIGLVLAAGSLIVGGLLAPGADRDATYVPVQASPSGEVIPGPR